MAYARLTQEQQNALRRLVRGTPINQARDWLLKKQITEEGAYGWGHLTSEDLPTVWGGTLDGIRALHAAGVSKHDPAINESLKWLFTQQREDGGFGSREVVYSAVESTAWILIVLKELGYTPDEDERMARAVQYLDSCVGENGEVATSVLDSDNVRIMPSVLTLSALHSYSKKSVLVARFLKDVRDVETGGWGSKPGAVPNPQSTCQVLNTLLETTSLTRDDVITQQAVQFILARQNEDGSWNNFSETWFSKHQPHVPLRCDDFTTAWAVQTLINAGVGITTEPLVKALSWLILSQKEPGYWQFDPLDDAEHVWCVSDCTVTLVKARTKLMAEVAEAGISALGADRQAETEGNNASPMEALEKRVKGIWKFVRVNAFNFIVVFLALYIFREQIFGLINQILEFFKVQTGNLIANLIASLIWSLLLLLGTVLLGRLRDARNGS